MLNNDGVFAVLKGLLIFEAPNMNDFLLTTQKQKYMQRIGWIWFVLVLAIVTSASAQYRSAVGLRLGGASGITAKMGLGKRVSVEGQITTRWGGVNFTALAEITQQLPDTPGLAWYYGIGGNIGFWDDPETDVNETKLFLGADGIVGMEYTFPAIPVNLAFDWKPYLNIISRTHFVWDEFALSIRYVIN